MSIYIKKLGYIFVIFALLLTGCFDKDNEIVLEDISENNYKFEVTPSPTPQPTPVPVKLTLDDVITIANSRRHVVKPDEEQLLKFVKGLNPDEVSIEKLTYKSENVNEISSDEAIEDVNIFFNLLRSYYGLYNYFGGDDVFLPIFDDILTMLETQEQWYVEALYYQQYNRLSTVITDNHFYMGFLPYGATNPYNQAFNPSYNTFICEIPFDKFEGRFYQRETGEFVKEIKGYNADEIFRLTMDENGAFCYLPIIIKPTAKSAVYYHELEIVFDNGKEEIIKLTKDFSSRFKDEGASFRYEGNIPIVTIRNFNLVSPNVAMNIMDFIDINLEDLMSLSQEEGLLLTRELEARFPSEDSLTFLSSAEELRNAPIIILDMRSNTGGDAKLPKKWLHTLTGENVPNSFVMLYPKEKYSLLTKYTTDYETYFPSTPIGNYQAVYINRDTVVQNDRLIILLVDKFTASSAEIFTDQLLNIENTLIIGKNTMGDLLTSASTTRWLPNSQITFMMSDSPIVHIDDEWQEGVGITPDIWVNGDALTATLAMLEKR